VLFFVLAGAFDFSIQLVRSLRPNKVSLVYPHCTLVDRKSVDDKIRKFYHDCLDEWLNKSSGTGIFYLKQEGFIDYGNEDVK